ncbi:MAG: thioredoxin-dependent thiol peroxidase [Candidatus Buchananbacteria bacterium]|nr:thioredoxin-dependent thiol peroxidase [Candidatus Buchananbacteria bacterium]
MKLKIGQKAPAFLLPDQNGTLHKLSQYAGGWLLIYFYPKDDTPGCTKEACTIKDNFPAFGELKANVVGISADSVASHKKFAVKYKLPFTILSDEEKKIITAYGVYGKKSFMGKTFMGIKRTSFLIDPKGTIVKIYENVKPPLHAKEVIDDLKALS